MTSARKLWLIPSAVVATCVTTVGLVAPSAFAADADTTGPTITVKSGADGADGIYRSVSFKLYDAGKVAGLTLNGVNKNLTASTYSDLNGVKPGAFGAVEGKNVLVVRDAAGQTTELDFTLDTTGPQVTVEDSSVGRDGVYSSVNFKLHDGAKVAGLTLNGVAKDLTDNVWSDLNGVKPGTFGAKEGVNTLVVSDALGNTTTVTFTLDTTAPDVTVKPESVGQDGSYRSVSFKLHDAGKIDGLTLNGVNKDLTDNVWSDLNGVRPGTFGAVEGKNTLVVRDVAGNTTTVTFTLDTTGPEIIVKDSSLGTAGEYRSVSFQLHDATSKVDFLTLNGVTKDLTDNAWSDLNDVMPGQFGAVEGDNTLVVTDTLGNSTTLHFTLDTQAPEITVKPESVGADGVYRTVSFKLHDLGGKIDGLTLNGANKDLTDDEWSDLNDVKPGTFGAIEGDNTLVVRDLAGNTTTLHFTLDTTGPDISVKPESVGSNGSYQNVSFKLHDAGGAKVDYIELNGVKKDLTDNVWSDLNFVKPGTFGAVEGLNTLVAYDTLGNSTTKTFTLDTQAPVITVKPESVGADGVYRTVSFKLHDLGGKIDGLTLNGVDKDLTDDEWSDLNGVKPGAFGAVEGDNTLVVRDLAGNTTTLHFTLDTTGPAITVKPESVGSNGSYQNVSFKLQDIGGAKVDRLTLNGVAKDLTDDVYSDLNGVKPGTFGAVEGENTLVVFDTLGSSTTVTFRLDTTRPVVHVTAPADGAIVKSSDLGKVTVDASDAGNLARVSANLYRDGSFFKAIGSTPASSALGTSSWTGGWFAPTSSITDGEYTVRAGATDVAGNWGGANTTLTIDDTAPAITVPAGAVDVSTEGVHELDLSQAELHPDWSYIEIDQMGTDGKWQKVTGQRYEGTNTFAFTVHGDALTAGVQTQVKITSVDLAGNRTSKTVQVAVAAPAAPSTSGDTTPAVHTTPAMPTASFDAAFRQVLAALFAALRHLFG